MMRVVERPAAVPAKFYVKVDGDRMPAVWRRTAASNIHATTDGKRALCGDPTMLQMAATHDVDVDLSRHHLTCDECAGQVFRVRA